MLLQQPRQTEEPRERGDRREPGQAGQQVVANAVREFGGFVGRQGNPGSGRGRKFHRRGEKIQRAPDPPNHYATSVFSRLASILIQELGTENPLS